jgi:hypothetical protein
MSDADRPDPIPAQCFEAAFVDTATSSDDDLRVVIPGYDDGEHTFGPVAWAPRVNDAGAAVFPADGDWALVTESDLGTWSVLVWTSS